MLCCETISRGAGEAAAAGSAVGAAFGAPAVLGLYFNVFHPLIQVFIFITLSLTFINEAIE